MKIGEMGGSFFLRIGNWYCPALAITLNGVTTKMHITYLKNCLSTVTFSQLGFFLFFCGF